MNRFLNLSVRRKLFLLFLVIIMPFLIMTCYSTIIGREEAMECARNRALQLVETVVAEQRITEAGTRQLLATLAKLPEFQERNVERCTKTLRELSKQHSMYVNLLYADGQGKAIASAQPFKPFSISHRKYFRDVLETRDFSVGEYAVAIVAGRPVLHYAYPVMDKKKALKGILVAAFDLDHYGEVFKKANLPPGSNLSITDYKGVRLFRFPIVNNAVGKKDLPEMMTFMAGSDEKGTFFNAGIDGVKCLYAFSRIRLRGQDPPYLFIRAGIPEVLALEGADELMKKNIFIMGLTVLASIYFAWYFGNLIFIRRLERLNAFAEKVQKGEPGARTALPHASDELGLLAKSFDNMSEVIEKRGHEKEQARRHLDKIIEFLPDATFVIDNKKKVIAWNRAIEKMTGVPKGEMIGKGNYEYAIPFYGERRPIIIDLAFFPEELLKTGNYDAVHRDADKLYGEAYVPKIYGGQGAYIFITASSLFDDEGNVIGAIESIRDITKRKRAEEALKESESSLQAILRSAADGFLAVGMDNRVLLFNERFEEMWKIPPEVMASKDDAALLQSVLDQLVDPQGFLKEVKQLYTSDADSFDTLDFKDGRVFERLSRPLMIGAVRHGRVWSFRDVTRRERAEAERRDMQRQLSQAQKMEAVGTLAGGIAHDFNNILGAIIGSTEMALMDLKSDTHLENYLKRVLKASERAKDLVAQILTFSRHHEKEIQPVKMTPMIREVTKLIRASLPSSIRIQREIMAYQDTVLADPTQIHQVLMNLFSNAAHAMGEGRGTLKISLRNLDLKVDDFSKCHVPAPGPYVKLTVSDTGHGMEPWVLERIFDPFFTTKKTGEGTGLGLSVVHGIVKNYGGSITVESEPRKGTSFHILLPAIGEGEGTNIAETKEPVPRGTERILFIDDEEALVRLAEDMLTRLGYKVVGKTGSLDALDLFNRCPESFDIVITDQTMPDMTGKELAKEIIGIRPDMPIILCSGFLQHNISEDMKSPEIREFVSKPVDRRAIAETIRRVLDQKG